VASATSEAFAHLARRIESAGRLLRTWPLTGGASAQVTALEIALPDGGTRRLLVRRHGEADLRANPRVAAHEFELLRIVRARGIPAPEPIHVDESGALLPSPFVVVEFIDGETLFEPNDTADFLRQLAEGLARIHAIPASAEVSFLPARGYDIPERRATLDESMREGDIRDALESRRPLEPANPPVLLHGDYWPGNILWRDGEIAAVIDWEDAHTGDPLSDLANARLELLFFLGAEPMQTFTDHYLSLNPLDTANLAWWDLVAALRPCGRLGAWGLNPADEQRIRERHGWFVERAIEG
jgi:aminoglycoside phosphotransferase (APT) family kinase protein